jgi:hypothetical protein
MNTRSTLLPVKAPLEAVHCLFHSRWEYYLCYFEVTRTRSRPPARKIFGVYAGNFRRQKRGGGRRKREKKKGKERKRKQLSIELNKLDISHMQCSMPRTF